MRGKEPKERERYVLRMGDGTLVEVTREVFLEWHQSRRREKYQKEKNQRNNVCCYAEMDGLGGIFPVTDSLEETAIRNLCREKVRKVMEELSSEDAHFVYLLYYEEVPVKKIAQLYGCSRRTIYNRKKRILNTLRLKMQKAGIQGGCF